MILMRQYTITISFSVLIFCIIFPFVGIVCYVSDFFFMETVFVLCILLYFICLNSKIGLHTVLIVTFILFGFVRMLMLSFFPNSYMFITFHSFGVADLRYTYNLMAIVLTTSLGVIMLSKLAFSSRASHLPNFSCQVINRITLVMQLIKAGAFLFLGLKMGEATSIVGTIVDAVFANFFIIDLLMLFLFISRRASLLNMLLYVIFTLLMASKGKIFFLILIWLSAVAHLYRDRILLQWRISILAVLMVVVFGIIAPVVGFLRHGNEISFFSEVGSLLGLFRRLGMLDNTMGLILTLKESSYFSVENYFIQLILSFLPNFVFDGLGQFGRSIGDVYAHELLGQPKFLLNAYETSYFGTLLAFSEGSWSSLLLLQTVTLLPFIALYASKDLVVKQYALFMFSVFVISGDVRAIGMLLKHALVYKYIFIPLYNSMISKVNDASSSFTFDSFSPRV